MIFKSKFRQNGQKIEEKKKNCPKIMLLSWNWGENGKKWAKSWKKMIFESKLGQKNIFLNAKLGQEIKKKKNSPKTEFLSQIWGKNGKKWLLKPKLGEKWQKKCKK